MTERRITTAAIKALEGIGARVIKIHGGPMQSICVDLLGCFKGRMFALEGKAPGQKPTPRQQKDLDAWALAGAITGCYTSAADAVAIVLKGYALHYCGKEGSTHECKGSSDGDRAGDERGSSAH